MNLINKRICFPVALNCSYGGNTIASLSRLADILVGDYCATVNLDFSQTTVKGMDF